MAVDVICPDCGGVIGTPLRAGTYVCHCNTATQVQTTQAAPPPPKEKVCCQCGKDLRGHRRFKDSLGYWCIDCHRQDKNLVAPQGAPCDGCGRIVEEEKLNEYGQLKICSRCLAERRQSQKRIKPVVIGKEHRYLEYARLIWLSGILLILVGIILLRRFNILPDLF